MTDQDAAQEHRYYLLENETAETWQTRAELAADHLARQIERAEAAEQRVAELKRENVALKYDLGAGSDWIIESLQQRDAALSQVEALREIIAALTLSQWRRDYSNDDDVCRVCDTASYSHNDLACPIVAGKRALDSHPSQPDLPVSLDDVQRWCGETFADASLEGRIAKLREEFAELEASNFEDVEEMADLVIVLAHLADWQKKSLMDAIRKKHIKNTQRVWAKNEHGGFSHVATEAEVRDGV